MRTRISLAVGAVVIVAGAAWTITTFYMQPGEDNLAQKRLRPSITAPLHVLKAPRTRESTLDGDGTLRYQAQGPSPIALADVPRSVRGETALKVGQEDHVRGGARIESRFSNEQIDEARAAAAAQPASAAVQNLDGSQVPVGFKPTGGVAFNSIDAVDCCAGTNFSAFVPPDIDMAAGPNHLIAVVNTAFEVYDKQGNSLAGPIQFATFFDPTQGGTNPGAGTPTPGCTAFAFQFGAQRGAVFDPDVVYDPVADRFVIGIDGGGTDYCVAATQTGDPTGMWNRFGFPTDVRQAFFDFPHMGVGEEAIFMGSNQFGGTLPFGFQGRIFAMDKDDLYNGTPLDVVTREVAPPGLTGPRNVKLDGTPQPAQQQPVGTPFYIMTEFFDGKVHSVYSWDDPFGADVWALEGDVDLAAASGVPCEGFSCFPIAWPQKGSVEILEGNDFRGHETEFRNGLLWTTQTISCNPGQGTRNCIRWAQIDPTQVVPAPDQTAFPLDAGTDGVIQAAVIGSDWDYRIFSSIAADNCNDMAIGYSFSKAPASSGGSWYPSIYVTGRESTDPLGQVGGERLLKKGTDAYSSFQDNGGQFPERWGDYTGMTLDPNGKTFWYAGQFSAGEPALSIVTGNPLANWGTFIGSFEFPDCSG